MQVIEIFDKGVRHYGGAICMDEIRTQKTWTYLEVDDVTHRVAAALLAENLGRGHRVAVLSSNDSKAFMCQLGVLRAGAAYIPLNVKSSDTELAELLKLTKCNALFYQGAQAPRVAKLESAVPTLRLKIAIGDARCDDPALDDWIAPSGTRVPLPEEDPEAPAWIMGTGGTTGLPKAVVLSQRAVVTQTWALVAHMPGRQPVQVAMTPMTHASGGLTYPVLLQGGSTLVLDGFNSSELLDVIDRRRPTRFFLPPTAIYALLAHPTVRDHDYSCLRHFLYGSAPMSTQKLREALEVFGPVMTQFYGQAEAPTICTFMGPDEHVEALADEHKSARLASCGRASYVAQVRVQDSAGSECPTGEVGEITVRTPLRMSGYLNDPVGTAEVDRGAGWQGTGDLGYMDGEGYIYIVDRLKDMIISGGFNVYPSEVEQVLWRHQAIAECAVIGVPDDYWGEAVTAVVEVKEGAAVSAEDLISYCKGELGSIKAPKSIIFETLPRSSVGKVLKREVRDRFRQAPSRSI